MANLKSLIARRWPLLVVVALLALLGWQASQPTSVASALPSMPGQASMRAFSSSMGRSSVEMAHFIAPRTRRWRTSARVSMPESPGTPCSSR